MDYRAPCYASTRPTSPGTSEPAIHRGIARPGDRTKAQLNSPDTTTYIPEPVNINVSASVIDYKTIEQAIDKSIFDPAWEKAINTAIDDLARDKAINQAIDDPARIEAINKAIDDYDDQLRMAPEALTKKRREEDNE